MNSDTATTTTNEETEIPVKPAASPKMDHTTTTSNLEGNSSPTKTTDTDTQVESKSNEDSSETSEDLKQEGNTTTTTDKEESCAEISEKENEQNNLNSNENEIENKDKVIKENREDDQVEEEEDNKEKSNGKDIEETKESTITFLEDGSKEREGEKLETNQDKEEEDKKEDENVETVEDKEDSQQSNASNFSKDSKETTPTDSLQGCRQEAKVSAEVNEEDSKETSESLENSKESSSKECQEKVPPDNNDTTTIEDPPEDMDEVEYEDVEIPDENEEELIVPDAHLCNGEGENSSHDGGESVKENQRKDDEEEDDDNTFNNQEPELVSIEEAKDKMEEENAMDHDEDASSSNNGANDPLNCLEEEGDEETSKDTNVSTNKINDDEAKESTTKPHAENDDDDDDEVLFVETRNSPICIESDDEDVSNNSSKIPEAVTNASEISNTTTITTTPSNEITKRETRLSARRSNENERQTINLPKATITVPKNLTVTRTSARKSTAKPAEGPMTNRPKNFQYLQNATTYRRSLPAAPPQPRQVVDTIELLDSSDEESQGTTSNHAASLNRSLPNNTFHHGTPPKRTLMAAKNPNKKSPNKIPNFGFHMPSNFAPRRQTKKPAPPPPPLPPATPQSNFLNNFKLQPATVDVTNPPAFSALLSNKNVIIPNAFYGNPPGLRTPDTEVERRYARWLDMFIGHFANPQLVASHSCLSFLQKALKYTDFVRIKAVRLNMNDDAATTGAGEPPNSQLASELRSIFLKSSKELTPHGRRFCELSCAIGSNKPITLLVHAISGKVVVKSCNLEIPSTSSSSNAAAGASATNSNTSASSSSASSASSRKRHLEDDEDEYVPGKKKQSNSSTAASAAASNSAAASHENTDQSSGDGSTGGGGGSRDGPKRSLRSKRAKRLDNSFSYNEDDLAEYDLEDEEEQAERLAREAVQRKIDAKRLEAQRQRQRQAQSFEMAFLKTFARTADGKVLTNLPPAKKAVAAPPPQPQQQQNYSRRLATNQGHYHHQPQHRDAEEHLMANWIENVENEDTQVISDDDDDEPREHRIYKQQQQQQRQQQHHQRQQQQPQTQRQRSQNPSSSKDSPRGGAAAHPSQINNPRLWPKNIDINHSASSKNKDVCMICKLSVQRIVHHYVNEHRGSEVYNSRLSAMQLDHLKRGACNIQNVSIYKNGQPQYEAHCIFCQKQSRFMFPYWVQHFTMHTGEYAYRCSACGMRKPTRSLLTQHQAQGCTEGGGVVLVDYNYDSRKIRVEARICTLCNYVQLHRNNIVKHLHQQHNIKQILPKHIQTIVLLKEAGGLDSSSAAIAELRNQTKRSTTAASVSRMPQEGSNVSFTIDDDDEDGDDNTLLFSEDALPPISTRQQQQVVEPQQQNHYYNYIPPYMMNQLQQSQQQQQNFTWEDNDPTDDLSFMICGMLDVQMNNNNNKKK